MDFVSPIPAVLFGTQVKFCSPVSFNCTWNFPVLLLPSTNWPLRYNEYSIACGLAVELHVKVVVFPLQNRSALGALENLVASGLSNKHQRLQLQACPKTTSKIDAIQSEQTGNNHFKRHQPFHLWFTFCQADIMQSISPSISNKPERHKIRPRKMTCIAPPLETAPHDNRTPFTCSLIKPAPMLTTLLRSANRDRFFQIKI